MTPRVSVVIPNYNHAPYLKERIDSVLNQTFQDFELILLDDCSTDNSRDIINSYAKNPHVSHISLNEENTRNTFVQWERGVQLACGEYIWIAESDDVAEPTFLATLVGQLEQNPLAVVAYSHSLMIDSNGQELPYTWHKKGSSGDIHTFDGYAFIRQKMLVDSRIYNASMAVFRKSVFQKLPKDYQEHRFCGDWLFWTYVCQHGQVIEVCQRLNRFRQHENKVSVKSMNQGQNWRDNASVISCIADLVNITPLQRRCLRGRWTKRFRGYDGANRQEIKQEFAAILDGNLLDICCYEIGKCFGFLKNQ